MDIEITRLARFSEPEGKKLGEFDARFGPFFVRRGVVLATETGQVFAALPQRGGHGGRGISLNPSPERDALLKVVMMAWHEAG